MKQPYKWQRRTRARRVQDNGFALDLMRARADARLALALKPRSPLEIVRSTMAV